MQKSLCLSKIGRLLTIILITIIWGTVSVLVATTSYADGPVPLAETASWIEATAYNSAAGGGWGDMDGDGDLDFVVGNSHEDGLEIYINQGVDENGQIILSSQGLTAVSLGPTSSIALGDADGDGDLDVAVGKYDWYGSALNKVYINQGLVNGQVSLVDTGWIDPFPGNTYDMSWGDVNGDGKLDLAIANAIHVEITGTTHIYLNTTPPGGSFQLTPVWTNTANTKSIAWGDVDRDGDLDLAISGDNNWQLFINQSGTISTTPVISIADNEFNDSFTDVSWGDMNGDGFLELAVSRFFHPSEVYSFSLPNGVWQANKVWFAADAPDGMPSSSSLAWGDVDNDGDLDLAVEYGEEPDQVYLNVDGMLQPTANWTADTIFGPQNVAWADINGDGNLDLTTFGNSSLTAFLNQGGGLPTLHHTTAPAKTSTTSNMAWGDIDNDGQLELAIGTYANSLPLNEGSGPLALNIDAPNFIYRYQNGSLEIDTSAWSPAQDYRSNDVAWGDVNNDGWLDLAVANAPLENGSPSVITNTGWNEIYLNSNGTLAATPAYTVGNGNEHTTALAWADINGDGYLDLATGNHDSFTKIYLNNNGIIEDPPTWSLPAGKTIDLAFGDIDNDGDLDLALAKYWDDDIIEIYHNNSGQLSANPDETIDLDYPWSVAFGDVDGDGKLDLAVGVDGGPNKLFSNQNGTFQSTPGWFSGDADFNSKVMLADVNGDGFLDLTSANGPDFFVPGKSKIYLNRLGQLASATAWVPDGDYLTGGAAWGDANRDGRLDLALSSSGDDFFDLFESDVLFLNQQFLDPLSTGSPAIALDAPQLAPADFYATSVIRQESTIPISYTLSAPLDEPVRFVRGFYSPNGGGQWFPAINSDTLTNVIGPLAVDTQVISSQISYSVALLSRWRLDEGSGVVAADDVSSNDGNLINSPTWTTTTPSVITFTNPTALAFDGIDDYVVIADSDALDFGPDEDFTISLWVKAEATQPDTAFNFNGILEKFPPTASPPAHPYGIRLINPGFGSESGHLAVSRIDDVGNTVSFASTQPITDGQFYHVALVKADDTLKLYLNGAVDASAIDPTTGDTTNDEDLYIGQRNISNTHRFAGIIDEVRIYQGALSDSEVAGLANGIQNPLSQLGTSYTPPRYEDTYIYNWGVLDSGFFGKSDNVVFRLEAYPGYTPTVGSVANSYRYPYVATQSYPFRVRGTQVQVLSGTVPVSGALVYRLPAGQQVNGSVLGGLTPFTTDQNGYLTGRGQIGIGDQLLALAPQALPPSASERFSTTLHLYFTNGSPTENGLTTHVITQPGVQRLQVSSDNPLLLFDLDLSLEWDASQDPAYLQQLEFDLQRASQHLYDFSDGQVALGDIWVYQNADNWTYSHINVHATNRLRPYATIGGVILTNTLHVIPELSDIGYGVGQVHIGATWNRYGNPAQSIGVDWPVILAHELGHYLLFLEDSYIGLEDFEGAEVLTSVDSCLGSAMGDVYNVNNTEFIFEDTAWLNNCADTLAQQELGRDEWQIITSWYPWLQEPTSANTGPSIMPYQLTTVSIFNPLTPTNALEDPVFYLDYANGEVSSSEARAFLLRNEANIPGTPATTDDYDYVYDLGNPIGGQNRLLARGAQPGDRLCIFDQARSQFGCEIITFGDERLSLKQDDSWQPVIKISPVHSTTFNLQVEGLPGGITNLHSRIYPEYGAAFSITGPLSETNGLYQTTLSLPYATLNGYLQLWVDEGPDSPPYSNPRRETIVTYRIGGNPGHARGGDGFSRGGGGHARGGDGHARGGDGHARGGDGHARGGDGHARGGDGFVQGEGSAPAVSPDGQMTYFDRNFDLAVGQFYTVQDMAGLPTLPPDKVAIGQGYNLFATGFSTATNPLTGSVSFQYSGNDVLAEAQSEAELGIHFWDGSQWLALNTRVDERYNLASTLSQGPGIYALMAGTTTPQISAVTPTAGTNDVTNTLTISGGYFLPPVAVTLVNGNTIYTLPVQSVSAVSITAIISPGVEAQEYQLFASNANQPNPATSNPATFALYDPSNARFYDFFESGTSKWDVGGNWDVVSLPGANQAITDSPDIPYSGAIETLTQTTAITSTPFNLGNLVNPILSFRHDYLLAKIGTSEDIAQVEISLNGEQWQALARYSGGGVYNKDNQPSPEWPAPEWKEIELDLADYSGSAQLRFSLIVDQLASDKGWLIDDVVVHSAITRSADLQLNLKLQNSPPISAGDFITYTLTVTNAGPDLFDVEIKDTFNSHDISFVSCSGGCIGDGPVVWQINNFSGSQVFTLTLQTATYFSGTLINSASISPTNLYAFDTEPANNVDSVMTPVTGPASGIPLLSITKQGFETAVPHSYIFYTLYLSNTGDITASNIVITDAVPVGATFVQAFDGGQLMTGNIVRWEHPQLGPSDNLDLSFVVTATATITNLYYGAWANNAQTVKGAKVVVTTITQPGHKQPVIYLPLVLKE